MSSRKRTTLLTIHQTQSPPQTPRIYPRPLQVRQSRRPAPSGALAPRFDCNPGLGSDRKPWWDPETNVVLNFACNRSTQLAGVAAYVKVCFLHGLKTTSNSSQRPNEMETHPIVLSTFGSLFRSDQHRGVCAVECFGNTPSNLSPHTD